MQRDIERHTERDRETYIERKRDIQREIERHTVRYRDAYRETETYRERER